MANLYSDSMSVQGIQFYKNKTAPSSFLVFFDKKPDFNHFSFFVNYLRYPAKINDYEPFIRGFYEIEDNNISKKVSSVGTVMIYIQKDDNAYNNVIVVNKNNENYLNDFGGSIKLISSHENYNVINVDINEYQHIRNIYPVLQTKEKAWWKFW